MAIKIRENPKIKGIKVLHSEHEISQFADDTSVILDGSEESLNETLLELEWFKKISGLKINFSKTQVIWIGSKKYSSDRLCENWNLSWGKTTFTVLGMNFDVDISKITKINYEKYLKKMKGLFKQWNKRNLTPVGKIAVVKSLILPVLNHLFIALPNPSIEIIKDIEAMLYTFIWKSSVNRVKKDIMQKKYQEGGLKMINIHSFILALKSTWIRRLFFNNCKWQNIFMSSIDINKLSCGGSGYIEQVIESVKNQFWKDVLYAWKSVIEKDENKDWTNFLANTVWLNKQVKIYKRTIFYPEWFNRGVKFVNDFVNDDGSFLTLDQFSNKFGLCVNFLQYNGVISSLRQMLKLYPYGDKSSNLQTPFVPSSLQNIFRSSKGSKDMYTILNKNSSVPTAQRKWNTVFDINSNEWKQIYILPFKATACTKLHWFQFRINHNILATNYFLKKIKIIDDANCNFCQKENETTEHIFWGCENVQNLLGQVNSWFGDKDINQTFFKKTLIFGDVDKVYKDDVYNAILLNIKYYIYTNRCLKKKLSFLSLKACLINLYKTEKMIAVRNQRIAEFQLHWSTFEKLFEDC